MSWASRRRTTYITIFALIVLGVLVALFFYIFYDAPSCADGVQNGDEEGVDCGGACERICGFQSQAPIVQWGRVFEVFPETYAAVALIENPNVNAVAYDVPYTFTLRDETGLLVQEVHDTIDIPSETEFVVFESVIRTGARAPTTAFFEFDAEPVWIREIEAPPQLRVRDTVLTNASTTPRLTAVVANPSLEQLLDVDVYAIIFDPDGNTVAASRTLIDELEPNGEAPVVFTWPEPLAVTPAFCAQPVSTMLAIDRSGSMNNDGVNPSQPLTAVLDAARSFVEVLTPTDAIGVVSFATEASAPIDLAPTTDKTVVQSTIESITIRPEDEEGYTNIGAAINEATNALSALETSDVEKVLVLLTDGVANYPLDPGGEVFAEQAADRAKTAGITLYTIGLGDAVNETFLRTIASSPEHYFGAMRTDQLAAIYEEIAASVCERGPAVISIFPQPKLPQR